MTQAPAPAPSSSPPIIVAIDGGAASGKSSTARALAARFGLLHVDTGAFYRQVCAELMAQMIHAHEAEHIEETLAEITFTTRVEGNTAQLLIDGRPAGDDIRSELVNKRVSHYAALPAVRSALLAYQRSQPQVARDHGFRGVVMEGRDIGSVIFPDADFRFFLHADPIARAARRAAEGRVDTVVERDRLDTERKAAPLLCPPGAIDIDSTHLTLEEVVEKLSALIAEKLAPVAST